MPFCWFEVFLIHVNFGKMHVEKKHFSCCNFKASNAHSKLEEVAASSTSVMCYTVWILIDFLRQEGTYCQDLLHAGISTVHVSVDHSLLDNTSHFHLLSQ